jgi:hypothetical protein
MSQENYDMSTIYVTNSCGVLWLFKDVWYNHVEASIEKWFSDNNIEDEVGDKLINCLWGDVECPDSLNVKTPAGGWKGTPEVIENVSKESSPESSQEEVMVTPLEPNGSVFPFVTTNTRLEVLKMNLDLVNAKVDDGFKSTHHMMSHLMAIVSECDVTPESTPESPDSPESPALWFSVDDAKVLRELRGEVKDIKSELTCLVTAISSLVNLNVSSPDSTPEAEDDGF